MKQQVTFKTVDQQMDGEVQPGGFRVQIVNAENNEPVVNVEIAADAKITVNGSAFNGAELTQQLTVPGQYYPRVARVSVMGDELAFAVGPTVSVLAPITVAIPVEVAMKIIA